IVLAIAWLLTVDFWCDTAGLRKKTEHVSTESRMTPGGAASRRQARSPHSRPTTRKAARLASAGDLGDPTAQGLVVGRVVTAGAREVVADASVRLALTLPDGSISYVTDYAEEDGRFALPIPKPDTLFEGAVQSVAIEAETLKQSGHRSVPVAKPFEGIR